MDLQAAAGKKLIAVITIRDKCNVRSGPGKDNAVLFTTDKGISIQGVGEEGWVVSDSACGRRCRMDSSVFGLVIEIKFQIRW